jgi:TolB protein
MRVKKVAVLRGARAALLVLTALAAPVVSTSSSATGVVPGANGRLVFARQICQTEEDPCWEIVVADATDAEETVVAGPYPRSVWDDHFIANWSPDGRSVVFMADLGTGQAIWQVNADGTGFHRVFAAPPDGTGLDDGPAFTPDGAWIVFTRCCPQSSGYGLWRVHPDGTRLRIVTTETVGVHQGDVGASDNLPQVSPDGRTILFHRNSDANRVATVNFAGGRLRELTPGDLDGQIPNWSPNGRRIVFQGSTDAGVDVWAVNPDGAGLTNLTNNGVSLNPSYSPDGTKIVFAQVMDDGTRDLFTMNPDGTGVTQVTHTPSSERWPQWAPSS